MIFHRGGAEKAEKRKLITSANSASVVNIDLESYQGFGF
jgi:hypothetical protein